MLQGHYKCLLHNVQLFIKVNLSLSLQTSFFKLVFVQFVTHSAAFTINKEQHLQEQIKFVKKCEDCFSQTRVFKIDSEHAELKGFLQRMTMI